MSKTDADAPTLESYSTHVKRAVQRPPHTVYNNFLRFIGNSFVSLIQHKWYNIDSVTAKVFESIIL